MRYSGCTLIWVNRPPHSILAISSERYHLIGSETTLVEEIM
jgi:hypothetical protein